MPYATGDDLVTRYDVDLVGDSATDDRETLTRAEAANHPNVKAALAEASGKINSALRTGDKYQVEQLQGLTGDDQAYLVGLTCDLAMVRLAGRRAENSLGGMYDSILQRVNEALDDLRNGEAVFDLPEVMGASVVDTDGPTAIDLRNRNALSERMSTRYFAGPQERLPRSQGGQGA